MQLVFRYSRFNATLVKPDLTSETFEVQMDQGSVINVVDINAISETHVNIVLNDELTYWNVPLEAFEIVGDQRTLQPSKCCT